MCEFAERCRLMKIYVKMHGIPDDGNNILEAVNMILEMHAFTFE